MQELVRGGILAPSFVVSFSHDDDTSTRRSRWLQERSMYIGVHSTTAWRPIWLAQVIKPVYRPFN